MSKDSYVFKEKPGASAEAPVLFLFHGTGGDENQFLALAGQLLPEARLVAPRGDVSEHGANRFFKRTGEGVYDMDDLALRTRKMADFVTDQIGDSRPSQVIGLGYSNGANILASVLFAAPELFTGAVLMHPLIPFAPPPAPALARAGVLITAGRRDPICPAPQSQALADYFAGQGARTELVWHEGGHEVRNEELAAVQRFLATAR